MFKHKIFFYNIIEKSASKQKILLMCIKSSYLLFLYKIKYKQSNHENN